MSDLPLPKGWRSSQWWQVKAAESIGAKDVDDHLDAVKKLWGDATLHWISEGFNEEEMSILVARVLVEFMAMGEALGHDLGVCMSIVCNRIEQGVDPVKPEWLAETPAEFLPEVEKEKVESKPEDPKELIREVSGTEIWVDLSGRWDEIKKHSDEMECHVKKKYKDGYLDWSGRNFLISIAGEFAYGIWKGEEPNLELLKEGDGGTDFPGGVNVKATPANKAPHLLLPEHEKITAKFYVLVSVEVEHKRARIWGWAPGDEIAATPVKPYSKRRIPTRAIPSSKLKPMRGY